MEAAEDVTDEPMEERMADFLSVEEAYENQWELLHDFMSLLDVRLYYLYKYHMWVGPKNSLQNMMGLVVSREEFEMNLSKAAETSVGGALSPDEANEIEAIDHYFDLRLQNTKRKSSEMPVLELCNKFGLDAFETNCLLLSFCVQIEKKYEKIFAYLQDDITKKQPVIETVIHLFAKPHDRAANYYRYFTLDRALFKFFFESAENSAFLNQKLNLRKQLFEYFLGGRSGNASTALFDEKTLLDNMQTDFDISRRLESIIKPLQGVGGRETVAVFLQGAPGSGRRFQIKNAVRKKQGKCLFNDLKTLGEDAQSFEQSLYDVICEAVLKQAYLCFYHFEALLQDEAVKERHIFVSVLNSSPAYFMGTLFIVSEAEWKETGLSGNFVKVDITFSKTDESDRLSLWNYYAEREKLNLDINLEEFASKFRFTPGQIKKSISEAAGLCSIHNKPIDSKTLHQCCYAQVVMHLGKLATRVTPAYNWEDIILPRDQKTMLKEACNHVRYRHTVFHEWGYSKKIAYGSGLSMLFSGPPGTGKTMAAQVVANYLHMEMYKIQLSQIVSKYIGETEKNLRQVFDEAKNANCILFFDETDALFGKRSEVKDSHDRNANIEVAYLLQQMEEYDGVIIMATNLLQNIDAAFMRRINFVISFPFPEAETRLDLWKKMLDTDIPLSDDIDLEFIARQFKIAGGGIKNIVLHAAFLAAAEGHPLTMKHLLKSAVNEQRKNNIIVVKEDLLEYADLIFGEES